MSGAWQTIKELHTNSTFGAKEGVAFRYFSRPLASFILYFIKDGRITPNQVTILSLIVGIAGSLAHMVILPYWGLLLGGALFMLAHVLDALDGQLARHRKAGSEVGMHFDFFIDELKAYLMYGALAVRLFRQHLDPDHGFSLLDPLVTGSDATGILLFSLVGLGGLAIGISCTQFFKLQSWKAAFPPTEPPTLSEATPPPGRSAIAIVEKLGHFIVDYPSYILILCIANRVDVYLILYTLTVCAYAARSLLSITLRLWRVNPYAPAPSPESPAEPAPFEDAEPSTISDDDRG